MYSVYADDVCIYNDSFMLEDAIIIEPNLTLEANAAGSFEFTLPSTNKAYETAEKLKTEISVRRDGVEIWAGRIISEEKDYWNNRKLVCEGELAFFNDSTQPLHAYNFKKGYQINDNGDVSQFTGTVKAFLEAIVAYHNSFVGDNSSKLFQVDTVTVNADNKVDIIYTNYEKTMECINDQLINVFGGYLIIRKEDGIRYLDYLSDIPTTNTQTIDFGKNLMDFTTSSKSDECATVILPLGQRLATNHIDGVEEYLTIKDVNDGSPYIQNDDAVTEFGRIVTVVHWDEIDDKVALKGKASNYITDLQFDTMTIELSALDLHYLNPEIQAINIYEKVLVKSEPHGLVGNGGNGKLFPVTKMEIPLDNPENTMFTLGTDIKTSLTDVNNSTSAAILKQIENSKTSVLDEAKKDASDVMNHKFTGYVTVVNDDQTGVANAIYISNTPNYKDTSTLWRWNMAGLGYTRNYSPTGTPTWETAITMDGKIVADFITAGTMSANRISGGTLVSNNRNVNFDLTNGTLTMNAGSINIANKFIVDVNGNLTANNASVKGSFFAGSNENNNDWVQLSANGKLIGGKGSNTYGYIDYSAAVDVYDGQTLVRTEHGIKMAAQALYLSHDSIYVREQNDSSRAHRARTVTYENIVSDLSYNSSTGQWTWTNHKLIFVNGLLCGDVTY